MSNHFDSEQFTPTHQYIFYITGNEYRSPGSLPYTADNFCLMNLPNIEKVNMAKWQTMPDEERYQVLCACFELMLQSNYSLSKRISELETKMDGLGV